MLAIVTAATELRAMREAAMLAEVEAFDYGGCGDCGCCPCGREDCDDCQEIAAWRAMDAAAIEALADEPVPSRIRGGSALPAVTADIRRDRSRLGPSPRIAEVKREAHHRHRRAWRTWCREGADPDREPCVKPGTGWEVW